MWFIYLTYYLLKVVGLNQYITGLAILSGQITDGLVTPIVGYFSDNLDMPCGKRNFWYFMGSLIVIPSFLFMFMGFENFESQSSKEMWYLVWPAIFNIGWAAVQIAHLAIVN